MGNCYIGIGQYQKAIDEESQKNWETKVELEDHTQILGITYLNIERQQKTIAGAFVSLLIAKQIGESRSEVVREFLLGLCH